MDEYSVSINGVRHTMQLSKDDADRLGLTAKDKVAKPSNKAATPDSK